MPSFFSTSTKPLKKHTPVFAGLDDPFNFPTAKMRYNSRSTSPISATDSGYGSIDDDSPLSQKAEISAKDRRRLQKDGRGHWRVQSYEYQSEDNDHTAEQEPILGDGIREADDGHKWRPDPKRTFTAICNDKPKKEKWYTKRIYVKALEQKDRNKGLTDLQRSMAPLIRRPEPMTEKELTKRRPEVGARKGSTLLHPSPPSPLPTPSFTPSAAPTPAHVDEKGQERGRIERDRVERGRGRKPSTLLHSSPPLSRSSSMTCKVELRSPRNRSPTPLGIPTTSERQHAPTPLRIQIGTRKMSVLHSCFSDDESETDVEGDEEEFEGVSEQGDERADDTGGDVGDGHGHGHGDDAGSVSSIESAVGAKNGVIIARMALVARAQRVKVRSAGLKKSVEGVEVQV